MVSPQPPAFSCRFRRSATSVIAVPVYKSRAYSRAERRCLPPSSPHGSGANWSFQGQADAARTLEARPVDVIGPADDVGEWHRPALPFAPAAAVDGIVAIVAQDEIGTIRHFVGTGRAGWSQLPASQDVVGSTV